MSDNDKHGSSPSGSWPTWLTPKRWWEFSSNVIRMERTVNRVEAETKALKLDMDQLRLQLERQSAQIELLTNFVRDSISKRD